MKHALLRLSFGVALALSGLSAAQADPVQQHNSNALWFENWGTLKNASLIVTAPNGKIFTIEATKGTPVFKLTGSEVQDGTYAYELTAATDKTQAIVNPQNNGRGDAESTTIAVPFLMNGAFTVSRGVIIVPEAITE